MSHRQVDYCVIRHVGIDKTKGWMDGPFSMSSAKGDSTTVVSGYMYDCPNPNPNVCVRLFFFFFFKFVYNGPSKYYRPMQTILQAGHESRHI